MLGSCARHFGFVEKARGPWAAWGATCLPCGATSAVLGESGRDEGGDDTRQLLPGARAEPVTPYFETQMVLDQMPQIGAPERLRFEVYPGGHMFYARAESRMRFRDAARTMMTAR